jgi:hypothetical protein
VPDQQSQGLTGLTQGVGSACLVRISAMVREIRHVKQLTGHAAASYLVRLVCRLGGCGPAVVMRTGSHLGGGPAPLGPAPTLPVEPLRARLRPPPAPAGVFSCPRNAGSSHHVVGHTVI